jgi:hypothetical protein
MVLFMDEIIHTLLIDLFIFGRYNWLKLTINNDY